ncbi:MAG TPA: cytochrome P450 [Candidatus Binatia bacterium]|nr:cytochrome P450 [Candidatus Binatia bacterium]
MLPPGPTLTPAETTFRWLAQPYALLEECAATLGGTFTLQFTRFGTHVVVTHPDDVRDVLTGDRDVLHAGRGNALLAPILGRHSVLVADGERHFAQRATLQPAFRSDRTARYARLVIDAARRWSARLDADGVVGMQRVALEISKEVILRAVVGLETDQIERFSRLVHELMLVVGTNATFDPAADEPRVLARFRAARGALDVALQEHVERRRAAPGGDDVLAALLGAGVDDEEIRDQLITMILAGHETTASSIAWALVCLVDAPDALERTLDEIDAVAADGFDERVIGLPYLQAVCLETLRLRPVVPVVSRELQRPFRLRDQTLPAGVFVTPCAYLAHRRPASFPDAETFRPERFLEQRFSPYAYFPFGGGSRRCIGMSLALLEMQIVLGTLLRTFGFTSAAPAPVRAVRRGVTIVPSGGARMRVVRRAPATAALAG